MDSSVNGNVMSLSSNLESYLKKQFSTIIGIHSMCLFY